MYKIIGADQKEYGPVTTYQINQWIVQGRVNALTKARPDGGEWKTLDQFPEFAEALANRATSPPPAPLTPSAQSSRPAKTSGLAIASLVLGILGLVSCGLSAIVGLILGIISMNQIKKSDGTLRGNGIALAGIIVSAVMLLILPVAMFLPAMARAKGRAIEINCAKNLKQLHIAALMYTGTHTNNLPLATNWCDALKSFAGPPNVFLCPAAGTNGPCDYAFNTNLSGKSFSNVNPSTVLFFESDGGWNASGGPELMIQHPRHFRSFVVICADGHFEFVNATTLSQLRWNP